MSIRLMSAVFESTTLAPTERLIMLALADHADDDGRCYPSIARLCQRTGLSERAVQTNIRKLASQGYIKIIPGGGKGNSNLYFVSANPAFDAPFVAPNPAADAPRRKCTPAADAPQTPQQMRANPAADAPEPSGTPIEPDDDDDAGAREPPPVDNFSADRQHENPTLRERILVACGADPVSGLIGPNGGTLGTQADMFEVGRWQADLGLDGDAILAVVTDTMARKRDGPPRRLSYFTRPMQEEAARRAAPPLQPIQQEFENHARGSQEIYAPGERIPGDRRYGSGPGYRGGSAAHRALYEGFARFAAQVEAGSDDD